MSITEFVCDRYSLPHNFTVSLKSPSSHQINPRIRQSNLMATSVPTQQPLKPYNRWQLGFPKNNVGQQKLIIRSVSAPSSDFLST